MGDNSQDTTSLFPSSWALDQLGNLAEVVTGNTPSTKDKENYGGQVPFVKPPQLQNCLVARSEDYLTEQGCESARVLPPDSVLVSCIGNLGRTAINTIPVAFNQQINAIKPSLAFHPKFLFYQAQSLFFSAQLNALASATTVAIVNKGKFETISLRIAPKGEQERIVSKIEELFSELDNSVASLKKAKEQLKVYRQAVLKHAFEGKLTAKWREENKDKLESADALLERIKKERAERYEQQVEEWKRAVKDWEDGGGEGEKPSKPKKQAVQIKKEKTIQTANDEFAVVPDHWKEVKLQEVALKVTDGEHATPKRTKSGFYLLSARNVQNGYLSLENVDYIPIEEYERIVKRCHPEEGDILISCSGTIGRVCRVPENIQFGLVRSVALVKLPTSLLSSSFIEYMLQSPFLQKQMNEKKKATAQANLFLGPINDLSLLLVPQGEQEVLVNELDGIFSSIGNVEAIIQDALQKCVALRQSILKSAFQGKLVQQDPNDEPASKLLEKIKAEIPSSNGTQKRKTRSKRKKK